MARQATPGRRDIILTAALLLFAKKGYGESTVADVARKAKVAVGTVYLYFHDKSEILRACAERFHQEHQAEVQRILSSNSMASEKLEAYLSTRFKKWAKETHGSRKGTDLAQAMVQASPTITQKEEKLWTATLTNILEQGVTEGLFHFESMPKELKIFHFNLVAYFPLPGTSQVLKPSEKDLTQMIRWFCQKWSLR